MGATIAGVAVYAEMLGDYLAAIGLGVLFQYFAIAPMRGLGLRKGLVQAAKADVLSLTSFEVGLFGWMALMSFVISRIRICIRTRRSTGSSCRSAWSSGSSPRGRPTCG